jgi:hypothetical protein
MRFTFGKLFLAPVLMAGVALAANSAKAETNVNVPFSFSAAGKIWPAGQYVIHKDLSGGLVTVLNRNSSQSFTALLGPGEPGPNDTNIIMKFDEVGAGHALRTVQYGPVITSRLDRKALRSERLMSSGR